MNYADYSKSFTPIINIIQCDIKENWFYGDSSTLIYTYNAILKLTKNAFNNNGYLSDVVYSKTTDELKVTSAYNDFSDYSYTYAQQYGGVWIAGSNKFPSNLYHELTNNTFQFQFA